jgi:hypothetical protein
MRSLRILGWTASIVACLTLLPAWTRAQDATGYGLPDTFVPTPLSSPRPEQGIYCGGDFTLFRQTVPLGNQVVAVRGFKDVEGNITGLPGMFLGSGSPALTTKQVTGPGTYDPGFKIFGGYRFFDGSSIEVSWLHMGTVRYTSVATPIPGNLNVGPAFVESFLTAKVSEFPLDFSGPPNDINGGTAFGIWNAATEMTESFTQRTDIYEILYRLPAFYESDCYRTQAIVGPKMTWLWQNYNWKTFAQDVNGNGADVWNAFYTNIVSNRLYGVKIGCSNDWYLGHGFAVSCEPYGAPMIDFVKEVAKYERGDLHIGPERKRAITDVTVTGNVGLNLNLDWYPYEGIQLRAGINLDGYFNTKSSLHPIDFDYASVTPTYDHQFFRLLRGFQFGVAFKF